MQKLSFIIPCYNSQYTIGIVVEEIITVMKDIVEYDYEIILVNDFSPDNTLSVIRKLAEENTKILGVNFSKNFGQPSATLAGCALCSGDIIVYLDDDGQIPVNELSKLLNKLEEGYDVVFGDFSSFKKGIIQKVGSKINNLMAEWLINKPKGLYMGSFWVCKRFVIKNAINCSNPFPYLAGIFLTITNNMASVKTTHRNRLNGVSNYSFKKLLALWLNGFTAFSIKPLRFASLIGFISSFLGFFYLIFLIIHKYYNPNVPIGYSSIMSIIIFIGGIIMIMLGLLGEYIGRIYINLNNTPQYIIKEIIKKENDTI